MYVDSKFRLFTKKACFGVIKLDSYTILFIEVNVPSYESEWSYWE